MSDTNPSLTLGLGDGGRGVVILDGATSHADLAGLLAAAPGLATDAAALARAANHFATAMDFAVIEDPAAFAAAYRARLAAEDPDAPWTEGVLRLRDHGVPDFAAILAPRLAGGRLTFFATDRFLGVPYRVEADVAALATLSEADYRALPLTPLPHTGARPAPTPGYEGPDSDPPIAPPPDGPVTAEIDGPG
jgi:hypothetical protein